MVFISVIVSLQIQKASCSAVPGGEEVTRKGTISQYFTTLHCPVCDELTQLGVCSRCRADPQRVAVTLHQDMREWERQQDQLLKVRSTRMSIQTPNTSFKAKVAHFSQNF